MDDSGDEDLNGYALPPRPVFPGRLLSHVDSEHLRGFIDGLGDLTDDEARVLAIREELQVCRARVKYLTAWRTYYCCRMWLMDVPTHVIAKAAGVADSYVSKRAREMGYRPRRSDKRRDG